MLFVVAGCCLITYLETLHLPLKHTLRLEISLTHTHAHLHTHTHSHREREIYFNTLQYVNHRVWIIGLFDHASKTLYKLNFRATNTMISYIFCINETQINLPSSVRISQKTHNSTLVWFKVHLNWCKYKKSTGLHSASHLYGLLHYRFFGSVAAKCVMLTQAIILQIYCSSHMSQGLHIAYIWLMLPAGRVYVCVSVLTNSI
jgi:hypothetical protein